MLGYRWGVVKYVPFVAFLLAVGTLVGAYLQAKSNHHIPSWLAFPPLNMLSVHSPERYTYMFGLLLVSGLFLTAAVPFTQFLMSRVERDFLGPVKAIFVASGIAFIALAISAVIPMQSDYIDLVEADENVSKKLNYASIAHEGASMFFMIASWTHLMLFLYISKYSPRLATFYSPFWWKFKAACLVVPGIVLLFTIFTRSHSEEHPYRSSIEGSGYVQWAAVGSIVAYFGSFAVDFAGIQKAMTPGFHLPHSTADDPIGDAIELQVAVRPLVSNEDHSAARHAVDAHTADEEERAGLLG